MTEYTILNKDFSSFDFHDCKIYALGFETNKFLLDIDMIEEWILKNNKYKFILYPATVVFENVWDVVINLEMDTDLIIDNIERCNPQIPRNINYLPPSSKEYDWTIELMEGEISFKSVGLKIFQRQKMVKSTQQNLSLEERNGISLKQEGVETICI